LTFSNDLVKLENEKISDILPNIVHATITNAVHAIYIP